MEKQKLDEVNNEDEIVVEDIPVEQVSEEEEVPQKIEVAVESKTVESNMEKTPPKIKNSNKGVNVLSNNVPLIVAFLAPVIVMIAIFIERGIFPFGDSSFLRTDMYHQYAPFFADFYDTLTSGGSLTYSWDIGMGINFTALYAYYLASPLNWLIILIPRKFVIEFMTYSIVLKIGLSGLTFAYYLKKHFNTRNFGVAFFGIFYALSGYMAAYSWNIMWLDCILLFPLIILGLERLVKKDKGFLYCITLGISVLSNYYISIMICIFMVIYFIALMILEKQYKNWSVKVLRFALFSILAGGMAAAVLIPEVYALQLTSSSDFTFPKIYSSYFSIFDMISRHLPNVEVEIGLEHWPNIYCGIAVFIFFPLYLLNKKIPLREKVVKCFLLLIFYASFSTNVLNFIWHGFHYPNSLPSRQSFIYIGLVLIMCFEAYKELNRIRLKTIAGCFWGGIAFILIAEQFNNLRTEDKYHFTVFYISIVLLAIYFGLLYLHKCRKVEKSLLIIFATTLVCIESAMNTSITSVTTVNRSSYIKQTEPIQTLVEGLNSDTLFYRIEKDERRTKNDGAWAGYPSVSIFSSTANSNLTSFFKKIGLENSANAYSFTGATPLISSLFSVKYTLSEQSLPNTDLLVLENQADTVSLYRNQYTLPLGFMIDSNLPDNWSFSNRPGEAQNNLSRALGYDNILMEIDGTISNNTVTFTPEHDGYMFVNITNKNVETVTANLGEKTQKFTNVNRGYLLDLGYCYTDQEIVLTGEDKDALLEPIIYEFSSEVFLDVYDTLNANPFIITSMSDTKIIGTVKADNSGYLFTSIPYENGWQVYVDGIKINTVPLDNTFMMIPVNSGSHDIKMTYSPQGFHLGAGITAGSMIILALTYLIERILNKREIFEEEKETVS